MQLGKVKKQVVDTVVKNKRKIVNKLKRSARSFQKNRENSGSGSDDEVALPDPAALVPEGTPAVPDPAAAQETAAAA